ncbi:MAG: PAS domain S-box protein [Acidobacteriaceae bacterium]|nr:PAS domain S-box protein [Acidobacteriaceae bacterium]
MARRLAFAILFTLGALASTGMAAEESTSNAAQQPYRAKIIILGVIAGVELLLIVSLIRRQSKSRSAETALQRKEEELRKSEEMFSKAFRRGPMALTLTSAVTQRYMDVNETYEQLTGFSREEVLGRTVQEIGLWVDPDERTTFLRRLIAERNLREIEFRFRRKDGTVRTALASAELIEIAGEECVLGVATDITDRKQAEQAVAESERRFRLIADSAPVLMWLVDSDNNCTDVNQAWLTFTGRGRDQELGKGWMENIHPDDLGSYTGAFTNALEAKLSFAAEHRLRRRDGDHRWMRSHAVPRFLQNGDLAGYIGCCIDITNEKEAKAARAEFSGRLIQAQEKERTRIARELHDDINQRMALLANGIERAIHTNGDYTRADQMKELSELWQLSNDIAIDIQHLSHQLHPSKLHYLGLATAVRDVCHEFSRQHGIEVDCNVHTLPAELDEEVSLSLFRTIQESLRNIAKHSHATHVEVALAQDSGVVKLRISDDGVGFDPSKPKNSSGLGLESMGERLRCVGGQFRVSSHPGSGTSVEGTVPVILKRQRSAYSPVD